MYHLSEITTIQSSIIIIHQIMNIVQGPFKLFQNMDVLKYLTIVLKTLRARVLKVFSGMSYIHKCMHFHLITVIKSPSGA